MNAATSSWKDLINRFLLVVGFASSTGVINARSAITAKPTFAESPDNYVYDQSLQDGSNINFRPSQAASGTLPDGTRFSVQNYESSDGVDISIRIDTCSSRAVAKKKLLKFVKNARVIKREPKLDQNGAVVGERFVVRFPAKGKYKSQAGILWVNKAEIYYIQSSSLQHAIVFEKRFHL
ncbi:MAG TPA: hypothetical protein VE135_20360 [Pyrinomonadaceae bacterium]|nr:hypothetical protein [Pyrinomonadaceae bacterium]